MDFQFICQVEDLEALSENWYELWHRSEDSTPFQLPAWVIPWWRHFGEGQLFTIAFRECGRLVALFPLYINSRRELLFLGTGITDYLDAIVDEQYVQSIISEFYSILYEKRDKWDRCIFKELRLGSPLFFSRIPELLQYGISIDNICPYIPLPNDFNLYLSLLKSGHRRKVSRAKRLLERSGELRLGTAEPQNIHNYMNRLFKIHRAEWHMRKQGGLLNQEALKKFHLEAATRLIEQGSFRLFYLNLDGKTISAVYCLQRDDRLYSYIGGFDPDFHQFSPGAVIILMIIQDSIQKGLKEFDFLRGSERYKYLWRARDRINYNLSLTK